MAASAWRNGAGRKAALGPLCVITCQISYEVQQLILVMSLNYTSHVWSLLSLPVELKDGLTVCRRF